MKFIPLYYGDKLRIINPNGVIGVVCLWSKQDYILKKLASVLDMGDNSKIALLGNLYGNGVSELAANLLYNPQISALVVCGSDLSGSKEDLRALFEDGTELSQELGAQVKKIKGRNRSVNSALDMTLFQRKPVLFFAGDRLDEAALAELRAFVLGFEAPECGESDRKKILMEKPTLQVCPTEPRSLVITADNALDGWKELVFCLNRFGVPVMLRKGERRELQNVKVVINSFDTSDDKLAEYGFSMESIKMYQKQLISSELPSDQEYTYGNRIRDYYGFDFLQCVIDKLSAYSNDRDCYLSLWDPKRDTYGKDAPCMVSLFFRYFQNALTLTSVFRTHNGADAWLKNAYGIRGIQEYVADRLNMACGPVTIISHSISLDTARADFAARVAASKRFALNMDYNGQVLITLENNEIAVTHTDCDGVPIKVYHGTSTERLQHELYRDRVISDINHAMYIGRMLEKAKAALENHTEFIQS